VTRALTESLQAADIAVGDELPPFELPVTSTVIIAGAIASRDFMPAHHDRDFAVARGAPDLFMNMFTTNGYVSRYITDWAGPESMVRSMKVRLGAPSVPGQPLRFSGEVTRADQEGDECVIEVAFCAATELGDHATGTVVVTLPMG